MSSTAQVPVEKWRVAIVEDHALVREGVRRMVESFAECEVVGTGGSLSDAVAIAASQCPDVLLLDNVLGSEQAIPQIPKLRERFPSCRLLVLSANDHPRQVRDALTHGADGYLFKDCAEHDLLDAIATVARGGCYVHPLLGARLAVSDRSETDDPLTEREREIARLIALGYMNHQIANRMFVSSRTVESHRANILAKLGLANRAELVRWALDRELIGPEPASRA